MHEGVMLGPSRSIVVADGVKESRKDIEKLVFEGEVFESVDRIGWNEQRLLLMEMV